MSDYPETRNNGKQGIGRFYDYDSEWGMMMSDPVAEVEVGRE